MTQTAKLLAGLIELPSVNTAFLPARHPRAGEHRVSNFLADLATKAGLDVQWQQVSSGRRNILVRLRPTQKTKSTVLLAPHLDTVDIADDRQLKPRLKNGRLYGRGACDTKGSVAAMFSAICDLARRRPPVYTEIIFAGLVDEEMGQAGSRALANSGIHADLAIVGEPTRLKVVTCHKGDIWLKLETRGKAAHGSRPNLGQNAVYEMARIVTWLQQSYAAQLKRRRHPLLGPATASVGTIQGGVQTNIVPDRCTITIDRRTLPGESDAVVRNELLRLIRTARFRASLASTKSAPCAPMETNPDLPSIRQFMRCARQSKPAGVDFYCDASVLSLGGIPSVVFGPGDVAQAHTSDEWISLDSLERARSILVNYLQALP